MNLTPVRDLEHLTELASRPDGLECFISLAGGIARSSKIIRYLPPRKGYKVGQFDVTNEIDDSFQTLWPKQLWTQSNVGDALDLGALIATN